jgi:glucose/mannose transport system substrate-binding protein
MRSAAKSTVIASTLLATFASGQSLAQESVEVLHWWTAGGEAAAVGVLKDDLQKQGVTWQHFNSDMKDAVAALVTAVENAR